MSQNSSLPPEDEFARALLRSAELDEPSHTAYVKVAAALGVSTAVGLGASLPAPAALAAGSSGLVRWSSSLGGKLVMLGFSGALLVGAGGVLLRQELATNAVSGRVARSVSPSTNAGAAAEPGMPGALGTVSNRTGSARTESANPIRGANAAAISGAAVAPEAALAGTPAPEAAAAPASNAAQTIDADVEAALANPRAGRAPARLASAGVARAASTAAGASSSLSEQVRSLDRARVALGAGDSSAALVEIAHYRKTWPEGVFLTEASVLEIEALAKRGERSLAAARAQAFVAAHPDSPQAERLRTLIPPAPADRP